MEQFGLTKNDILIITKVFQKIPEIEKAMIFGSRSKGNHKNGSDIDLAIMGKKVNLSIVSQAHQILEEETLLPYFFDVVDYNSISNQELINHIDRCGHKIYEKK